MEPMIPRNMAKKIDEVLRSHKIQRDAPLYRNLMKLVAPETPSVQQWVYGKPDKANMAGGGVGELVSTQAAKQMLESENYADHPHGPYRCNDDSRCWTEEEVVKVNKKLDAENAEEEAENTIEVSTSSDTEKTGIMDKVISVFSKNDKVKDLIAHAESLGIKVPKGSTKAEILALIEKEK